MSGINLSVGMNIGFLILLYSAVLLKSDLFKPNYGFVCGGHGYLKASEIPLIINVSKNNVTLQIPYPNIRRSALASMEQSYGIQFANKFRSDFMENGIIAAPISKLRRADDKVAAIKPPRMDLEIPPAKYKNSELNRWILEARMADAVFNRATLLIVVKADTNFSPRLLNHVRHVLTDQHTPFTIQ
ncbi:hypothetical protein [Mucilaginibacter sp. PPCGB 2223]|uniref:hypothetical protein n=1 Tax=Mucilaginibacter sp. PPCGB 2223 TaxID=1886027 RepID=UPI0011129241|nr:hypothetical protein [Mucilaginibacter sp. PPCGB 2223]